jgi:hypothetical protein
MKLSNAADQPRSMVLLFLDVLPKSFGRTATQLSNACVFTTCLSAHGPSRWLAHVSDLSARAVEQKSSDRRP